MTDNFKVKYQVKELSKTISRIWFDDPKYPDKHDSTRTKYITVNKLKEYCQEELVYIREGNRDILSPIKVFF